MPFQILLTTNTAVKCQGLPNWIHASHPRRLPAPIAEEVEGEAPVVTDNSVQESPESPSTTEEVLEVPGSYAESDGDEAVINEPAEATIIWADDLVPDSTVSAENEGESSVSTEPESTSAVENNSRREEQSDPDQRSQIVVSEEQNPDYTAQEQGTSEFHDCDIHRTVLRRSKRQKVPNRKYSGPDWTYYVDSGYICRAPLADLAEEEEEEQSDDKPP